MTSKIINSNTVLNFDGEEFYIKQIKDGYINHIQLSTKEAETLGYDIEQVIRVHKALR